MLMERTVNASATLVATAVLTGVLFPPAGAAMVGATVAVRVGVGVVFGTSLLLDLYDQAKVEFIKYKMAQMPAAAKAAAEAAAATMSGDDVIIMADETESPLEEGKPSQKKKG